MRNPFTPTFGRVPELLAGRREIIAEMTDAFENGSGDPNLSTIYTGARGTGKTALLLYLSRVAAAHGWVAVNVTAIPGMLEDIAERSSEAAAQFVDPAASAHLKALSIGQIIGVEWENAESPRGNWRTRMGQMLEVLNAQGVGLLITVDEVRPDLDEMVQLATVYQHFVGEERKVALLLAGLPGKVSTLLRNESVSFLRRAARHRLGNLTAADAAEGIRVTVEEAGRSIGPEALVLAADESRGFPYLMQLVGYHSWAQRPGEAEISLADVQAGAALAHRNFAERVLEATYYDLSPKDLLFLRAMLDDAEESRMADIASRLDEASNYVSTYKRRLVEQGVIGERGPSYVAFELPGFRDYLQEKLGPLG